MAARASHGSMVRALLVLCVLAPAGAAAQVEPCRGVTCSGHGECIPERTEPTCLCDEGYAAQGVRCVRASAADEARRDRFTGARIVHLALGEGGRTARQIGQDGPEPLAKFLQPSELWCSDFVSWIYHRAGVPFTGGYDGGWRIKNNVAIEHWFTRRELWVARGTPEWESFVPQPGDYLRFYTSRYGHSAIVRFVTNDTLYTIEGNVGGRVVLRSYRRFRDHPRIEGFGILVDPDRRRALVRALARRVTPVDPFAAPPRDLWTPG